MLQHIYHFCAVLHLTSNIYREKKKTPLADLCSDKGRDCAKSVSKNNTTSSPMMTKNVGCCLTLLAAQHNGLWSMISCVAGYIIIGPGYERPALAARLTFDWADGSSWLGKACTLTSEPVFMTTSARLYIVSFTQHYMIVYYSMHWRISVYCLMWAD